MAGHMSYCLHVIYRIFSEHLMFGSSNFNHIILWSLTQNSEETASI